MRWLFALLLLPLVFAAVGDGVCDSSDLLMDSPDCSPYVAYPLRVFVVEQNVDYVSVGIPVYNLGDKPAYVCIYSSVSSSCQLLPPYGSTVISVSVSLREPRDDHLEVVHSYGRDNIPVSYLAYYVSPQYMFILVLFLLYLLARHLS